MANNNISTHEFYNGSIIAILHSDEIQIALESAKLSQDLTQQNVRLTQAGTIKGVLTLSGVRRLEVNGKTSRDELEMFADDATILEFDIEGSRIHFFVEWGNLSRPREQYTDIVIEADRWSWEENPGSFDPNGLLTIEKRFLVPLIILAAPTMKEALADPLLLNYEALGGLAQHVVDSYKLGDLSGFPEIFKLIERLHVDGDDYVREAATIGFLEDLQNIAGHESESTPEITPEVFVPFLGPESKRWWDALNDFWSGKKSTVRL